jgi:acyl-coenzyme A thioesterase PaaI-like protein
VVFDPVAAGWTRDDEGGFISLIGPFWTRRREGKLIFGLEIAQHHLNRDGFLHGGMFLACFDHAIGIVGYEAGGFTRQVTIQLNTHFLKGAKAEQFMEIDAEVVSQTASLMFMRAVCFADGEILATADGIWKKMRPRGPLPLSTTKV